jgi:hypothetical protein
MRNSVWTRLLCALALAGALVAFTGCGGSDKKSTSSSSNTAATTNPSPTTPAPAPAPSGGGGNLADYKAGLQRVGADFKTSLQTSLARVGTGKTLGEKVAALDVVKQSVTKAADGFAALSPPSNVKAENDQLVSEMRTFASVVDEAKTAAQNKDTAKLATVKPRLSSLNTKIQLTLARIQAKVGG